MTSERDATHRGRLATGLRNNNGRCHLLSQGGRNTPNATENDHRNIKGICQILAQLVLVTVPPLDTCVLQVSVTRVVRQIMYLWCSHHSWSVSYLLCFTTAYLLGYTFNNLLTHLVRHTVIILSVISRLCQM